MLWVLLTSEESAFAPLTLPPSEVVLPVLEEPEVAGIGVGVGVGDGRTAISMVMVWGIPVTIALQPQILTSLILMVMVQEMHVIHAPMIL